MHCFFLFLMLLSIPYYVRRFRKSSITYMRTKALNYIIAHIIFIFANKPHVLHAEVSQLPIENRASQRKHLSYNIIRRNTAGLVIPLIQI